MSGRTVPGRKQVFRQEKGDTSVGDVVGRPGRGGPRRRGSSAVGLRRVAATGGSTAGPGSGAPEGRASTPCAIAGASGLPGAVGPIRSRGDDVMAEPQSFHASEEDRMRHRVYLRGPDDLHHVLVETDEPIDSADRLNATMSSRDAAFVELGGQAFRAERVVAVAEEVDRGGAY